MWYCAGCIHYDTCVNKRIGCPDRKISDNFREFVNTMVDAYMLNEHETLAELKKQNKDWYKEVWDNMSCLI